MRARLVNEKFKEEGDPVKDMGIGIIGMLTNWDRKLINIIPASRHHFEYHGFLRIYPSVPFNYKGRDIWENKEVKKIVDGVLKDLGYDEFLEPGRISKSVDNRWYISYKIKPDYLQYFRDLYSFSLRYKKS